MFNLTYCWMKYCRNILENMIQEWPLNLNARKFVAFIFMSSMHTCIPFYCIDIVRYLFICMQLNTCNNLPRDSAAANNIYSMSHILPYNFPLDIYFAI